jgi:hypothetical protein
MPETLDLLHLGAAVAAALGPEWSAHAEADCPNWATLRREGPDRQFGVTLRRKTQDKRIVIEPVWPNGTDGSVFPYRHDRPDCSITVGESRDPVAIAREIDRRLMPCYREAFTRAAAQRDEHDAYTARQAANLEMFAAMLGGSVRGECVNVQMGAAVDRVGYIHGFQVGGNSVQWEFRSVPIETARKLLEFWKTL